MTTTTTKGQTAATAGPNIATIIDSCNKFLNDDRFDDCVNVIRNELETYITKLVKFLDDLMDNTAAKKTMYLLRSYLRAISRLAEDGPTMKNSLKEHFASLQEYATEAEKIIFR